MRVAGAGLVVLALAVSSSASASQWACSFTAEDGLSVSMTLASADLTEQEPASSEDAEANSVSRTTRLEGEAQLSGAPLAENDSGVRMAVAHLDRLSLSARFDFTGVVDTGADRTADVASEWHAAFVEPADADDERPQFRFRGFTDERVGFDGVCAASRDRSGNGQNLSGGARNLSVSEHAIALGGLLDFSALTGGRVDAAVVYIHGPEGEPVLAGTDEVAFGRQTPEEGLGEESVAEACLSDKSLAFDNLRVDRLRTGVWRCIRLDARTSAAIIPLDAVSTGDAIRLKVITAQR